jgi:hypothetical protein
MIELAAAAPNAECLHMVMLRECSIKKHSALAFFAVYHGHILSCGDADSEKVDRGRYLPLLGGVELDHALNS